MSKKLDEAFWASALRSATWKSPKILLLILFNLDSNFKQYNGSVSKLFSINLFKGALFISVNFPEYASTTYIAHS